MIYKTYRILIAFIVLFTVARPGNSQNIDAILALEFSLPTTIGKLRAVPVSLSEKEEGILLVYSEEKEVDPYHEMFYFPEYPLKFVMINKKGEVLWQYTANKGVIPGIWFCPVFPFDFNQDGIDEIYFVNNEDPSHPLSQDHAVMTALNAVNGDSIQSWPWTKPAPQQSMTQAYRNFIFGGHVQGKPVLITAQGTYGPMALQAWNPGMTKRWEYTIGMDVPGARGSHMTPIVDLDGDGSDELMWGERCISLDNGKELFVADKNEWDDHSDVIQPVWNYEQEQWYLFTCREKKQQEGPRLALFDDKGERVWTDVDHGHMDMGWCANLAPEGTPTTMGIRIGAKKAGPDGFYRSSVDEFIYHTFSGKKMEVPFKVFNTCPVDLNGDGYHELVRAIGEQGDGAIIDGTGKSFGNVFKNGEKGYVAMASKFMDLPGEQILVYYPDGTIRIYADKNAKDSPKALKRYNSSFYKTNRKLTATGYNLVNLGGI